MDVHEPPETVQEAGEKEPLAELDQLTLPDGWAPTTFALHVAAEPTGSVAG
jgi:hypothetical protein